HSNAASWVALLSISASLQKEVINLSLEMKAGNGDLCLLIEYIKSILAVAPTKGKATSIHQEENEKCRLKDL
ncbi:MAG: hypothetical protein RIE59_20225, partial [Imperialibacter sp.]